MRVLVVHNRYRSAEPSGENAVVDDECAMLAAAGCTVERFETTSDSIADWPLRRKAALPIRVVWSREGHRLTTSAIAQFAPDVVHFHNTFPLLSPSSLWAARASGARVIQTLHNFRPLCPAAGFFREGRVCESCLGRIPLPAVVHGCYRGSRVATLPIALKDSIHGVIRTWQRCVDVFVTPSDFARRKYLEAGWPPTKLIVKPNTAPDVDLGDMRWHGAFVYLGRMGVEKGTDVLLSAWAEAFPHGGPGLRLIGSGSAFALSKEGAALRGIEFFGSVERSRALNLLAGARALVVPSRSYEVFPRVIVEAFARGVPVVASRVGSLPEVVEHGKSGLLIEPDATLELTHTLRVLASSDDVSRVLGRGARAAFDEKYSPQLTTDRLIGIYRTAISRANTPEAPPEWIGAPA